MIGIICGGGDYPRLIAKACIEKKLNFCLIFLNGFCSEENWPQSESISLNFGEIGKALDFLKKNKVKKIVFAGSIRRPDFSKLSLDKKGRSWMLKLGKAIFSGDDTLLRSVAALIQEEGFQIISGTDLVDDIFLPEGVFSRRRPSEFDYGDVDIGLAAAREHALSDQGQSVLVCQGKILGREDVDGTNALMEKCNRLPHHGGILVKISKPQQDERMDLPTIGPETIEKLHQNGFHGVALEADRCIVVDREEVIRRADELNIFIISLKTSIWKIFLIAGEASGDYLGGRLLEDISAISGGKVEFFGVGGPCMKKAGLREFFSINELSIIGIFEVVGKILRIKKLIDKTAKAVCDYQPNVVVTIDSSGFTHRVAKKIKKLGCKIPVIHYVAPPVWAWRRWRAKSMCKFLDKLLALLPFEPPYFEKHGLKTVFVGHPLASDSDFHRPKDSKLHNFLNSVCKIKKKGDSLIITLLPGSRASEIANHLPELEQFTRLMIAKYPGVKFIIPTIPSLEAKIEAMTSHWDQRPIIVTQKSQKVLSFYSSDVAVAASGTVTLELAAVGLPFVAIYKTSAITYSIVKFLIKVKNVCLVNLLAGENVVPELLQQECTGENIFNCVEKLLDAENDAKKSFAKVMDMLKDDRKLAAREVIASITQNAQFYK